MGLPLQTAQYYDNSGGLDLKSSLTKTAEDDSTASLNVDYATDGAVFTRFGSTIQGAQLGQLNNLGFFDFKKSDGTEIQIFQNGSIIYQDLITHTIDVTGLDPSAIPDFEFAVTNDDDYVLWGNGVDTNLKFNGTTWTNLSIAQPGNPTVVDNGVGVLPAGTYSYYIAFVRTVGGIIVQISDLNPVTQAVTIGANRQIRITRSAITDPQINGWVIYRRSPTSLGVFYQLIDGSGNPVIVPSVNTFYDDNIATDGSIEAEFDNQAAPKSAIIEGAFNGYTYYVDANSPSDIYESKQYRPWNVPNSPFIADGPVNCLKKIYDVLLISTSTDTMSLLLGPFATNEPKRFSSNLGVLNNRCADGPGPLYIMATNKKFYTLQPTDFSQSELRITQPISIRIEPLIAQISTAALDKVQVKYFSSSDQGKVMVTCPIGGFTNNSIIIFNETQTFQKNKPCWHFWDNICASLGVFNINGVIDIYSGDYNGYIWKLNDKTTFGDGAEVNGTSTSATNNSLTDSTQTWVVDAYKGIKVTILSDPGDGQERTIVSNTATTLTITPNWANNPNANLYTIGGYDSYHYTNWKSITGSYDTLKQLWYFISNLDALGDYNIDLIIQFDFDTTTTNQIVLNINLQAANSIWGQFIWGQANWGAQAVFQDRERLYGRFRSVRFGFRTRKAGQPFQVNTFSVSTQDKNLFYGSAK